jgi:hypothetical protein
MNSATSIFATEVVSKVAPKVGDLLCGHYGYEASLPTFAKVVGVTGKTIKVIELAGHSHSFGQGGMEWKVNVTNTPVGHTMTKRFSPCGEGYKIKWSSYQNLYGPWTPKTCYAYNYH